MLVRPACLFVLLALYPMSLLADDSGIRQLELPDLAALSKPTRPNQFVKFDSRQAVEDMGASGALLQALDQPDVGVDWNKHRLVYFRWQGSGRDVTEASVAPDPDGNGKQVSFVYRRGITRDLRQHAVMFLVPRTLKLTGEDQEESSDQAQVRKALESWAKFRMESGGNYSYTVSHINFTGSGSRTTMVVLNNKVVERRYRALGGQPLAPPAPGGEEPKGEKWIERADQLGTHKQGAPAVPLDDLYKSAQEIAARELQTHEKRYVRTTPQGLLTHCFVIDTRIADDAPRQGFVIDSIMLEAPPIEEK